MTSVPLLWVAAFLCPNPTSTFALPRTSAALPPPTALGVKMAPAGSRGAGRTGKEWELFPRHWSRGRLGAEVTDCKEGFIQN